MIKMDGKTVTKLVLRSASGATVEKNLTEEGTIATPTGSITKTITQNGTTTVDVTNIKTIVIDVNVASDTPVSPEEPGGEETLLMETPSSVSCNDKTVAAVYPCVIVGMTGDPSVLSGKTITKIVMKVGPGTLTIGKISTSGIGSGSIPQMLESHTFSVSAQSDAHEFVFDTPLAIGSGEMIAIGASTDTGGIYYALSTAKDKDVAIMPADQYKNNGFSGILIKATIYGYNT